jgi:circadian clock protein KaiB
MNSLSEQSEAPVPSLTLFITGNAPRSRRAQKNLASALERLGRGSLNPLTVDLLEHPEESVSHSVFATPALLKTLEGGEISIIYGDLSDEDKLVDFLEDLPDED